MSFQEHDRYPIAFSACLLKVAQVLTAREGTDERRAKKARVVEKKIALLSEAYPDALRKVDLRMDPLAVVRGAWSPDDAMRLMVDLSFSHPFAPYELKFKDDDGASEVGFPVLPVG